MNKSLLAGLFLIVLFLFILALLFIYLPMADASQEKRVSVSDIKIFKSLDDVSMKTYTVRVTVAEKSDTSIKLVRACFMKDLNFCIPVVLRGDEAVTWIPIGRPGTYRLAVYLEYEYVVAGKREPGRGRSNEVTTTITVRD